MKLNKIKSILNTIGSHTRAMSLLAMAHQLCIIQNSLDRFGANNTILSYPKNSPTLSLCTSIQNSEIYNDSSKQLHPIFKVI